MRAETWPKQENEIGKRPASASLSGKGFFLISKLKEKGIVLQELKTKKADLDKGVRRAFLRQCALTEAGRVRGVWPAQMVKHADLKN